MSRFSVVECQIASSKIERYSAAGEEFWFCIVCSKLTTFGTRVSIVVRSSKHKIDSLL